MRHTWLVTITDAAIADGEGGIGFWHVGRVNQFGNALVAGSLLKTQTRLHSMAQDMPANGL